MLAVGERNDSETPCRFPNQILGAEELGDREGGGKAAFLPPSLFKAREGLVMSASEGCDSSNRAASEKKTCCLVTGSSGFWGQAGTVWALEKETSSVFVKIHVLVLLPQDPTFTIQSFPVVSLNQPIFLGENDVYKTEVLG